jgi:membrane associated rhomboid family serine protease
MRYSTRYRSLGYYSSGYFPPGVKWLLIVNVAVFVLMYLTVESELARVFPLLFLRPGDVLLHGEIWRLGTYLFVHGGIWHLLVNMFTLWMFGVGLERDWGTRQFLKYYFLCGVGAGICDVVVNAILGRWGVSTIGASGAIYGLLLAFGVLYPDQTVLFSFLFPIKAKYFVMIYGAIELLAALGTQNSGVSNIAHLGGMAFGFVYLKMGLMRHLRFPGMAQLRVQYNQWKLQRAKKKFQVYMRKHGSGPGPWVN